MTFYINCANLFQGDIPIETSFKHPNDSSFFISLLDHLPISQFWAGNEFGSTRSAFLSCPRVCLQDTMSTSKGLPIGIHSITNPYRPAIFCKTPLCLSNKRFSQRRFCTIDYKRDHQSIFL